MSWENVEIVRHAFAAYERRDFPALLAAFSSSVVTRQTPPIPDARTYHGREGVMQALSDYTEPFDDFVMTGEEFIDVGNKVVVRVHQDARGAESGVPVSGEFWFVYSVGEGKIEQLEMFSHEAQALEAVGLSE